MSARAAGGRAVLAVIALTVVFPTLALAQVGKGLLDPNIAAEKDLLTLPHMTPVMVKALLEKRPFAGITPLDAFLASQALTPQQRAELYGRAFIHLDLNTATEDQMLLVPGLGKRMAHELAEYRPWKSFAQFDKEIGKYVDAAQVARLKQYVFIPMNLNTASDDDLLTIPGLGPRMLHEFKEYRPYQAVAQFRKEIGKYVSEKEVARLERYVTIP